MKCSKTTTPTRFGNTHSILATFIIALALLIPAAILTPVDEENEGSDVTYSTLAESNSVIDLELAEVLSNAQPNDQIEIIVQFRPTMTEDDLDFARDLGITVLDTWDFIHGMHGIGTSESIIELSTYENVFWMENNSQLMYFMHDTTNVVEAVRTWNSNIVDGNGYVIQDAFGTYHRIDGTGVGVAVIDTGVDAGHPDFDYDEGKTMAYKYTGGQWVETENSDTSSGHGTHCGGTIAGNGDASAGSRKGTAPGATLIGLGVGDLVFVNFGLDAFEWVYEHSRPDDNPLNIRVTSNSYGGPPGEYNPQDALTQVVIALAIDNNVITFFACGNSGGDGSNLETGPYCNNPMAIGVAAMAHDGSGIAGFSSRGHKDKPQTWPDIGAPGVDIWSTAPRHTVLDYALRTDEPGDLYYIPMSGTSMATPHMAGIGVLLYQAAPHLGIASYVHEDHETTEGDWYGENGSRIDTTITEAELILEMTASYIGGAQAGADAAGYPSNAGTPHDWGQGHGLVDVDHAIALALTLEELRNRDNNNDGLPDMYDITVFDAYFALHGVDAREQAIGGPGATYSDPVRSIETYTAQTDTVGGSWKGEWAHFTDDEVDAMTDNTHYLYIPEGVTEAHIALDYSSVNLERNYVANLDVTIDADGDGQKDDLTPVGSVGDHKHYEVDVTPEMTGHLWVFGMNGQAYGGEGLAGVVPEEFWEPLVQYNVGVRLFLEGGDILIDESNMSLEDHGMDERHFARHTQLEFGFPSPDYTNGSVTFLRTTYNLSTVTLRPQTSDGGDEDDGPIDAFLGFLKDYPIPGAVLFIIILFLIASAFFVGRKGAFTALDRSEKNDLESDIDQDQTYYPLEDPIDGDQDGVEWEENP